MQADIVFEEICWIEERRWEGSWWSSTPLSVPDLYVMLFGPMWARRCYGGRVKQNGPQKQQVV
jgi:hypothetical protein